MLKYNLIYRSAGTRIPQLSTITLTNKEDKILNGFFELNKQDILQSSSIFVENIILLDQINPDIDALSKTIEKIRNKNVFVKMFNIDSDIESSNIFEKLGCIRNLGTQLSVGRYISYLDDKHKWKHNHLSSLYKYLNSNSDLEAVHSWRTLWSKDWQPYFITKDNNNWAPNDSTGSNIMFEDQLKAQILELGSQHVRDSHGFYTRCYSNNTFSSIDLNEWLLERSILESSSTNFMEKIDPLDEYHLLPDDLILAQRILAAGVKVGSSHQATLMYSMAKGVSKYILEV